MELGWIDFSKSDRNKVFEVLRLLSEEGVLDELGIAPIRDAFSNIFFPGITTVQTRAKYFLIVPYAFRDLELSMNATNLDSLKKELKRTEKNSAIKMNNGSGENGIIGSTVIPRDWVQRSPSSIYLAGLRTYGIFKEQISIDKYLKLISGMHKDKLNNFNSGNQTNDEEGYHDDKNAGDGLSLGILNIETYEEKWIDDLTIHLTKEEGDFLKRQIISSCPNSLIAFILENHLEITEINSFYGFDSSRFPDQLKRYYDMAIKFSEFNYALVIVYNLISSQGKNDGAVREFEKLDFNELSKIDIDGIMSELYVHNHVLRTFLNNAKQAMENNELDDLKEVIIRRERNLKTVSRSRLSNPSEADPNKWYAGGKLDYRFGVAKDIINDIFESEKEAE